MNITFLGICVGSNQGGFESFLDLSLSSILLLTLKYILFLGLRDGSMVIFIITFKKIILMLLHKS